MALIINLFPVFGSIIIFQLLCRRGCKPKTRTLNLHSSHNSMLPGRNLWMSPKTVADMLMDKNMRITNSITLMRSKRRRSQGNSCPSSSSPITKRKGKGIEQTNLNLGSRGSPRIRSLSLSISISPLIKIRSLRISLTGTYPKTRFPPVISQKNSQHVWSSPAITRRK